MKIDQITSIFILNPYKMRHSTGVRALELINTYSDVVSKSPLLITFGKGFGGYFRDFYAPFPWLAKGDYSEEQIKTRMFFRPHNSPSYLFLKNGIVGILCLLYLSYRLLSRYIRKGSLLFILATVSGVTFLTVWGWSVKNSILFGTALGLIHAIENMRTSEMVIS